MEVERPMIERVPPAGHALVESILVIAQLSLCLVLLIVLSDRAKLGHINLETVRLDSDRCAISTTACDQSIPFGSYQENVQEVDTRLSRLLLSGTASVDRKATLSQSDIGWQQSVAQANLALVRNGQSGVAELFGLPDTSLLRSVSAQTRADIDVLGRMSTNFRLVTSPDAWYAIGSDHELRVRRGADPLPALASLLEMTFVPTKDVLMPIADIIGLERQTASFREAFHQDGWFIPIEGSLAEKTQEVRQ
jgi:hypothetical protein